MSDPDKSCDHKNCDNGDIMFLICQVNSREHIFKGLCEFIGGSLSWSVPTFPCLVAIGLVPKDI